MCTGPNPFVRSTHQNDLSHNLRDLMAAINGHLGVHTDCQMVAGRRHVHFINPTRNAPINATSGAKMVPRLPDGLST